MDLNCIKHHINRIRKRNSNYYSQVSVHCKKCLFIHIPKTGGVSVSEVIYGNFGVGHRSIKWSKVHLRNMKGYYVFTIVREPVDRFISAVNYLLEEGNNYEHSAWKELYFRDHFSLNRLVENSLSRLMESDIHFKSQTSFLLNDGELDQDINNVFRFEDFRSVDDMLLKKFGKRTKHVNVTKNKKFSLSDLSEESLSILKSAYCLDYKLLNYKSS